LYLLFNQFFTELTLKTPPTKAVFLFGASPLSTLDALFLDLVSPDFSLLFALLGLSPDFDFSLFGES